MKAESLIPLAYGNANSCSEDYNSLLINVLRNCICFIFSKSSRYQHFRGACVDNYLYYIILNNIFLQKSTTSMSLFNHKLPLAALLREIPEDELIRIAKDTRVDYCSKVLQGKLMFYLLVYGMLRVDRLSRRGLRDAFSSPLFRTVFNYHGRKEISQRRAVNGNL